MCCCYTSKSINKITNQHGFQWSAGRGSGTTHSLLPAFCRGGGHTPHTFKGTLGETGANGSSAGRRGCRLCTRVGAYAARTGRRGSKGAATDAARFACSAELLLEITELRWLLQLCQRGSFAKKAALPRRRLCQQGGFANKAALPTALGGGFAKTEGGFAKPGGQGSSPMEGGFSNNLEAAFPTIWRRLCQESV